MSQLLDKREKEKERERELGKGRGSLVGFGNGDLIEGEGMGKEIEKQRREIRKQDEKKAVAKFRNLVESLMCD